MGLDGPNFILILESEYGRGHPFSPLRLTVVSFSGKSGHRHHSERMGAGSSWSDENDIYHANRRSQGALPCLDARLLLSATGMMQEMSQLSLSDQLVQVVFQITAVIGGVP